MDRSASLLSATNPHHYAGAFGIVLAPTTPLLCGWNHDSGTASMANRGCGAVCTPHVHAPDAGCSWPPARLQEMLLSQAPHAYNEVIISAIEWQRALPLLVEAFVVLDATTDAAVAPGGHGGVVAAHAAFVERYARDGMPHAAEVARTPILRFTPSVGFRVVA